MIKKLILFLFLLAVFVGLEVLNFSNITGGQ